MKDFFHKNGVLLLVIALLLSLLVGISSALMGGTADPLSNAATTITAPVRSLVSPTCWIGRRGSITMSFDMRS